MEANLPLFFLSFFKFIYLSFIYFWLRWVFVAARRLSLVAVSGGYSLLQCACFSLQWLLLLRSTGSRHAGFSSRGMWAQQLCSQALEHRLSSCGAQAQLLRGMWDLPRPGIELVSPALAGGFLTTVPQGKSLPLLFKQKERNMGTNLTSDKTIQRPEKNRTYLRKDE